MYSFTRSLLVDALICVTRWLWKFLTQDTNTAQQPVVAACPSASNKVDRIAKLHKLISFTRSVCCCLCWLFCPKMHLSTCVSVLNPARLSICMSVHIPTGLSICVSVHVPAHLSICVSVCLTTHLCPSVHLSSLPIWGLSMLLRVCL